MRNLTPDLSPGVGTLWVPVGGSVLITFFCVYIRVYIPCVHPVCTFRVYLVKGPTKPVAPRDREMAESSSFTAGHLRGPGRRLL